MKQNLTQVRTETTAAAPKTQPPTSAAADPGNDPVYLAWEAWGRVHSELLRVNLLLDLLTSEFNNCLDGDPSERMVENVEGLAALMSDSRGRMRTVVKGMESALHSIPNTVPFAPVLPSPGN